MDTGARGCWAEREETPKLNSPHRWPVRSRPPKSAHAPAAALSRHRLPTPTGLLPLVTAHLTSLPSFPNSSRRGTHDVRQRTRLILHPVRLRRSHSIQASTFPLMKRSPRLLAALSRSARHTPDTIPLETEAQHHHDHDHGRVTLHLRCDDDHFHRIPQPTDDCSQQPR